MLLDGLELVALPGSDVVLVVYQMRLLEVHMALELNVDLCGAHLQVKPLTAFYRNVL